jgi:hypothetical protein
MIDPYEEFMSIAFYLSAFVLAATPLAVSAQAPFSSGAADAHVAVMPFEYRSAFDGYQSMMEERDAPGILWRTANEEVERIGGHARYMRSAQDTAANASADSPAEWSPVTPHAGHGGHHH